MEKKVLFDVIEKYSLIEMRNCFPRRFEGKVFTRKIWNGDLISSDGMFVLVKYGKNKEIMSLAEYIGKHRVLEYKPDSLPALNEVLSTQDMFAIAVYDSSCKGISYSIHGCELSERTYYRTIKVYHGAKAHFEKVEECRKLLSEHDDEVEAIVKSSKCRSLVLNLTKMLPARVVAPMKENYDWTLAWIDAIRERTGKLTEQELGFRFVEQ